MFLKIQFIAAFIFLTLFSKCHGKSLDTLVNTKVGLIRGLKAEDGEYSMFLGIPFGKVEENNPFGVSICQLLDLNSCRTTFIALSVLAFSRFR